MKRFTDKQIQIMRLGLGLSGLPCDDAAAETVLMVTDAIDRLGAKFTLRDASRIEEFIRNKYKRRVKVTAEKNTK